MEPRVQTLFCILLNSKTVKDDFFYEDQRLNNKTESSLDHAFNSYYATYLLQ